MLIKVLPAAFPVEVLQVINLESAQHFPLGNPFRILSPDG
jgi:hypothetical protein